MATGSEITKLDIGRVMQGGFEVLGRQFGRFLALALLLSGLPSALMNWAMLDAAAGSSSPAAMFQSGDYWGAWLITMLGGYLLQAAVVRSALLQLAGKSADIRGSLVNAFRLILPLLGLGIVSYALMLVGFLLLVVPGIILLLMLIVSVPVLVQEGGVFHSMRRSRELTRGSRGRIFLLLILFGIAYAALLGLSSALTSALVGEQVVAQAIVQGLVGALTALLMAPMLASLYFELRALRDGATVEGLAEVFA